MKIPSNINKNLEGQYCLNCYSRKVARTFKSGKTYSFCENCKSINERSLVIDNNINWWIDDKGDYWHESVGVIILNKKKELLVIMRVIYPFAYSLPAGHVSKSEKPLIAAQREVLEEVGLDLPKKYFRLIEDFQLPGDSCRRGCDHHFWHLYLVNGNFLNQTIRLNDEACNFRWFNIDQITAEKNLTYPLRYIVNNFKGVILNADFFMRTDL